MNQHVAATNLFFTTCGSSSQLHNWLTDNTLKRQLRQWVCLTAAVNIILDLSKNPRKRLSLLTITAQAITPVGEKM
jgi:hypothetical protein